MTYLDANIDALELEERRVTVEFGATALSRYFHLVVLECAEHMPPSKFAECASIAREQIRKRA